MLSWRRPEPLEIGPGSGASKGECSDRATRPTCSSRRLYALRFELNRGGLRGRRPGWGAGRAVREYWPREVCRSTFGGGSAVGSQRLMVSGARRMGESVGREWCGEAAPTSFPKGRAFPRSAPSRVRRRELIEGVCLRSATGARGGRASRVAGSVRTEWCILHAARLPGTASGAARTSFSRKR